MRPAFFAALLGWLSPALVFAQAVTPSLTPVVPPGDPTGIAATAATVYPPSLSGISGGGMVELGQDVLLKVVYYGDGTGQTYQWKKNGTAIAGATDVSLALMAVTVSDSATYTVTVTNAAGSSVATTDLTVKPLAAPVMVTQPRSLVLQENQPATFSFVATGSFPRTYQWRRDGNALPGATQATYTIASVRTADAAGYSVIVTNSQGSVTSTAATLTVNAATPPVLYSYQPYDTTATAGSSTSFSVSFSSGSSPFTYQWLKNGVAIPGATQGTLTITAVAYADAGRYSAEVTNFAGSATSREATLTVTAPTPVSFYSSPQNQTLYVGESLSLYVSTGGSYPITYQWQKDGVDLPGVTSTQLSIAKVALTDAGSYRVVATNAAGSVTSAAATVVVKAPVAPTITTAPTTQNIAYGDTLNLYVQVSGSPPLTYQWSKDSSPLGGATYSNYSKSNTTSADAGKYTVTITNSAGSVTSDPVTVTVAAPVPPTISNQPVDVAATDGDSVSFSVTAAGTRPLTYQWYCNGVALTNATSSYLSFSASLANAGSYHVVVTNTAGSVTSRDTALVVTPQPPPTKLKLSSQNATLGQSFSLSANYWSSSAYTYQWYHDGAAITGATSASYNVPAASSTDAGDYFVVTTNSGGATASSTAHVEVMQNTTPPPGAWIDAQRQGDILYFAFPNPARLERYNIVTESWLAPVTLPRSPAAFAVAADSFYVANGSIVYRYALDGSGEAVLSSAFTSPVTGIAVDGLYLIAASGSYSNNTVAAIRRSDGTVLSTGNYMYYWGPSIGVAANSGRLFSRTTGISPSDITTTTVSAGGILGTSAKDSPYHGDFPDAKRVFVSPDEQTVADDSGTIYKTADLTFAGAIGGKVDDLAFADGNQIVALRGGTLTVYNGGYTSLGRIVTGLAAARVFTQGGNAFAFAYPPSGGKITVAKVRIADATVAGTLPPVDGNTAAFTPDETFLDRNGVLFLYSKVYRQLFRWSTTERKYLTSIPLQGWPDYVTYSATNNRVYLGYADTRILQIKLDAGSMREESFAQAPQQVLGLSTADQYVFLVDPTGAWCSYFLFAPDGTRLAQRDWSYIGAQYVWDAPLRRMYQFRDDTSPNDLLYTEVTSAGTFGTQKDSPYHGEISTRYPIRISPDGGTVLLGSGKFFDASSMVVTNSLANTIDDATWSSGRLFTGRAAATGTELQRWGGGNYALDATRTLPGRLVRMFTLPNARILAVTVAGGVPAYTILDESLAVLSSDSAVPPSRLSNLSTSALAGTGGQVLTPGFVISGTQPKRVLIRAGGPALAAFGVANTLADPQLTVFDRAGNAVAFNDDWSAAANAADIKTAAAKVSAFAFAAGSHDAALLLTLNPGLYTAQVKGSNNATGVAIVEVYDADDSALGSHAVNIAARAQVSSGADLVAGFAIDGTVSKQVLIRGIGPSLSQFGLDGVLPNPSLKLYRGSQVIAANDDWTVGGSAPASDVASAATKVGAFPLQSGTLDSALLVTLAPGAYSVHLGGTPGSSGVAMIEVYDVSN